MFLVCVLMFRAVDVSPAQARLLSLPLLALFPSPPSLSNPLTSFVVSVLCFFPFCIYEYHEWLFFVFGASLSSFFFFYKTSIALARYATFFLYGFLFIHSSYLFVVYDTIIVINRELHELVIIIISTLFLPSFPFSPFLSLPLSLCFWFSSLFCFSFRCFTHIVASLRLTVG